MYNKWINITPLGKANKLCYMFIVSHYRPRIFIQRGSDWRRASEKTSEMWTVRAVSGERELQQVSLLCPQRCAKTNLCVPKMCVPEIQAQALLKATQGGYSTQSATCGQFPAH